MDEKKQTTQKLTSTALKMNNQNQNHSFLFLRMPSFNDLMLKEKFEDDNEKRILLRFYFKNFMSIHSSRLMSFS